MLNDTSYSLFSFCGLAGSVSTGLIQATPGDMKSFNVSTDRMADILKCGKLRARRAAVFGESWFLDLVQSLLAGLADASGWFIADMVFLKRRTYA